MKKLLLFMVIAFMTSCVSHTSVVESNSKAMYVIEEKSKMKSWRNDTYSISLSKIGNPTELSTISVGKETWKGYKVGDKLDENYLIVKE